MDNKAVNRAANKPVGSKAQQGQAGPGGAFGPGLDRNGGANARGYRDDGYYTGGQRAGGDGRGNWWIDTGNNSNLPGAVPPDRSQLPPDPELTYRQSVTNLNQLLNTFQNDPEEKRELQSLIQEMQRLDPKRFPGNPALLEQIHNQVINDVNNLELQCSESSATSPARFAAPTQSQFPPATRTPSPNISAASAKTRSSPSHDECILRLDVKPRAGDIAQIDDLDPPIHLGR